MKANPGDTVKAEQVGQALIAAGRSLTGDVEFIIGPVEELGPPEEAMIFQVKKGQRIRLKARFLTDRGRPAAVENAQWAVEFDGPITYLQSADGLTCTVTVPDADNVKAGTAVVTVTADADLGGGVSPITRQVQLNVLERGAVTIEVGADEPEDVPDVLTTPEPTTPPPEVPTTTPEPPPPPTDQTTTPAPEPTTPPPTEPGTGVREANPLGRTYRGR